MSRFHVYAVLAALLALPAAAQTTPAACDLQVVMKCTPSGSSFSCNATTFNAGSNTCSGTFYAGIIALGNGASVSNVTNSLGLTTCMPSSSVPGVPATEAYVLCFGDTSLAAGSSFTTSGTATADTLIYTLSAVEGATSGFGYDIYSVKGATCVPTISSSASNVYTTQSYTIGWQPVSDPNAQYVLDESSTGDFSPGNFTEFPATTALSQTFTKSTPGTFTYRVKANTCPSGDFSQNVTVKVTTQDPNQSSVTSPAGSTQPINVTLDIPCSVSGSYNASTDKPYITVTPPSGSIPPGGTNLTATVTPGSLSPGTNTGTVTVTSDCNGTQKTTNTPIQVSIVTPVTPSPKDLPPPNALVIPIVTHVNAAAGPFVSDIRLTNSGTATASYLVTMAPVVVVNGVSVPQTSQSTTITVEPQGTAALNDIVKNFFGIGATGAESDTGFGSLQIRPLDTVAAFTFAASRTYTTQAIGTFGQYVAAMPFSKFATLLAPPPVPGSTPGPATTKLSLQQVSHDLNGRFRANFGLVEGAGQPASGVIHVFDDSGAEVVSQPFNLNPGEVRQLSLGNVLPSGKTLTDGRIQIEITSQTGAVTTYASVLDNHTADPYAVAPVDVSSISATRYVLPGIAEFTNATSNFHSDARIFNGGTSDVTATLSFSPLTGLPGANAKTLTIPAGTIARLDNILPQFFGVSSGTGGAVIITTPAPSSLVATANTYSNAASGTFGQFIPGIDSNGGIGAGDRPLQILQLEESDKFRSNVGLAELTGKPVDVEISLYLPDSKVTPVYDVHLNPNEFKQLLSPIKTVLGQSGQLYNARIGVKVTGGTGRVAAYGSVIDNQSTDPTYVPAQ